MLSKVLQSQSKIIDILKSVHVEPGSAMFTIADYGSADGGVQMRLLYACVEQLRIMHGKQLPIQVIHEDQLCNNFNALFRILQGWYLKLKAVKRFKGTAGVDTVHVPSISIYSWLSDYYCICTKYIYFIPGLILYM